MNESVNESATYGSRLNRSMLVAAVLGILAIAAAVLIYGRAWLASNVYYDVEANPEEIGNFVDGLVEHRDPTIPYVFVMIMPSQVEYLMLNKHPNNYYIAMINSTGLPGEQRTLFREYAAQHALTLNRDTARLMEVTFAGDDAMRAHAEALPSLLYPVEPDTVWKYQWQGYSPQLSDELRVVRSSPIVNQFRQFLGMEN